MMKENKTIQCRNVRFRRFANRSYSAFNSVKREVNIGVLLISMLTFAGLDEVAAQTETRAIEKEYELDEVQVTASRAPLTISQSARMVTVLDRKAIDAAPVQSVNDLLKYAVGVDVRQRGIQGMQTDISLRGSTYDQITILLNGVNICDPQTGHNAADFPVNLNDIERIEILEGPAARVYGTSSLLGAINIVTRTATESMVNAAVSGGSYGSASVNARITVVSNNINNTISGSYNRSDGYSRNKEGKLNSDFNSQRIFYQGNYDNKLASVSWQAGMSNKDYAANTFYSARYDNQFEHTRKYFTSIQAITKGTLQLKPVIYWTRGEDRFELIRGSEDKVPFNYHRTDVTGININAYFSSTIGKTAIGGEMRNEDIISTVLGEPLTNSKHIKGTARYYNKGLNRTNISFHLEHNILLSRFTLSAGVMANKNTGNEEGFKIYPGVDAAYRITNSLKVYASWNTSLRMPTFTELYYTTNDTHQGNKNLKPEEMQAYETGVKYITPGVQSTISIYHHRGKNLIDWVMKEGETVWNSINHTRVNSTGIEVGTTLNFGELISSNCFLRQIYVGYSYIDQDKKETPGEISQYSLEYLKHKFVSRVDHRIWNKLEASWVFRWQEREGSYQKYANGTAIGTSNYHPYSLLDSKLTWNSSKYKLFVEANNIFNHKYYDYGNIPQPGFYMMAGASYRFNL